MPYVPQERRANLDKVVESMWINCIYPGDINYVLYAYCKKHVPQGYTNYRNFLGELNESGMEVRRRLLSVYEDEKIKENGDIE